METAGIWAQRKKEDAILVNDKKDHLWQHFGNWKTVTHELRVH